MELGTGVTLAGTCLGISGVVITFIRTYVKNNGRGIYNINECKEKHKEIKEQFDEERLEFAAVLRETNKILFQKLDDIENKLDSHSGPKR
jgi:predicted nuclease with TOPRIM domain